ncbi:MAG: ribosome assembly factor SBDS [Candidatus Aenigmarchaeota archaeon]|nr:ribosome assembly factor SBDS [Candidatus Aenigmarchaeota archaeon]
MVTVDKAVIARMEKNKKHFEVLVDPDLAYSLKNGKIISISKMLATNQVFSDSKKGLRASPSEIEKAFGTTVVEDIAQEIVKHGEIQLTTDFRRKKVEEKKRQIADFISKNAINPQTKLPHPFDRIINALDQVHVNIDPFKSAEQQIEDVIKPLKEILPLSFEEVNLTAEVPVRYGGKVHSMMKQFGSASEQWLGDRLIIKIKLPIGMKEKFYRTLNAMTEGEARIEEK